MCRDDSSNLFQWTEEYCTGLHQQRFMHRLWFWKYYTHIFFLFIYLITSLFINTLIWHSDKFRLLVSFFLFLICSVRRCKERIESKDMATLMPRHCTHTTGRPRWNTMAAFRKETVRKPRAANTEPTAGAEVR